MVKANLDGIENQDSWNKVIDLVEVIGY